MQSSHEGTEEEEEEEEECPVKTRKSPAFRSECVIQVLHDKMLSNVRTKDDHIFFKVVAKCPDNHQKLV